MNTIDIKKFRLTQVREIENTIKNDISKSKKIIDCIEIMEMVLIILSLMGSSLSAVLESPLEASILAGISSFLNGLTVAIKLKQNSEEKKLINLKHAKKQVNIKLSNGLDDNKLDHKEFTSIIEVTEDK